MEIQLKKIDLHNWEEAIDLPVSEDHKKFVASNLYSIAEAQFFPGYNSYAIYAKEKMVGFALYGAGSESDEDNPDNNKYPYTNFWIWRFMIAEGERFKGYGKQAMQLVVQDAIKAVRQH